jgi:UDP-N-acetyl-D-mannosaminuronate dehydrogenase
VGGHCIPVYPHFLLDRAPELSLVARAREVNDGQVDRAVEAVKDVVPGLDGAAVLVLGLTYRHGVKELAYSRAAPLIGALKARGARVLAHDPLLDDAEISRAGAEPWTWGSPASGVVAIVTQTADPAWLGLDPAWFPDLRLVYDGRNSLSTLLGRLGAGVVYRGVGVPDDRRAPVAVD